MWLVLLFLFGAALGSFLDVVAGRYDPNKFLFSAGVIGGRSHCMHCGKTLRWFELVPIVSFILQRGKCNSCGGRISRENVLAELIAGAIAVAVPFFLLHTQIAAHYSFGTLIALSVIWIVAFLVLLLVALIDMRIRIIPDEINIILLSLGIALICFEKIVITARLESFLGPYGFLFGAQKWIVTNHILGALTGLAFFGVLILITRGRGMGMGDVKLAGALGFLFGWPDIIVLSAFAFILGSLWAVVALLRGGATRKTAIPFGPFLAMGAAALFMYGSEIARWYFSLFHI